MALMGSGDLSSSALRFSRTRGRIGGSGDYGLQYPSPFFDIAQTYLPATVKQMFRWCRYYYMVNPLINTVANKMAEYPVTDIILDTDRLEHKEKWSAFLNDQLRYRAFQIEVGLDYYVYGNALVSIFYPFVKMLECRNCHYEREAAHSDYRFMNFEFHWNCPRCGEMGPCRAWDHYVKASKGIRLIRWNPEDVDVQYNDITGDYTYYYTIPVQVKNDIIIGKKSVVESVPQLFIEALRLKKAVVFNKENIFHFKRPTLAGKDRGWGTPMILPVLKDTFYLQILRKAQESIAMEHIVPLRVLFPQAGSASSDPYSSVNLADWRDQVANEIRQWHADNNYIPIMSLPIGQQTIGGDGRALLLSQEIRVWSEHIIAGMGVPVELIFGGLSYSGSNVSMRMLENMHLGYLTDHKALLHWVIERVSSYLGWASVKAKFKPFKMADDLQRKAYLFQLSQAGKISDETLLADADLDSVKEDKIMEIETARRANVTKKQRLLQAEIEGEAAMITQKWNTKAQTKMMAAQAAVQNEMAKDQGAFQAEVQKDLMDHQAAMQTGQPPEENPETQPSPRNPEALDLPGAVKSPLVASAPSDGAGSVKLTLLARQVADRVAQVPLPNRGEVLARLQAADQQLYDAVLGLLASGPAGPSAASAASARPLPQQRAPRRGQEAALV